ncbi:MAG: HTH domain-containing protein, partial [Ferruginibacter sp.]|nr:HTH domain-containing protein [Ferruginibacter sp.]
LYRALKNRITNHYKKKYLTEEKVNEYAGKNAGKTDVDAEGLYSYKEIVFIINKELESMPDKMKQVFLLSRDEQLSSKKISELLSISDQTVRNQISKAIKRIKITLQKFKVID